jgi:hypothetical protein
MAYLPEDDAPALYTDVLWVAQDGSYGTGRVLVMKRDQLTNDQLNLLDELNDNDKIEYALDVVRMASLSRWEN